MRPSIEELRTVCNNGYARKRCDRFPASAEADANRFSIAREREGVVELVYIRERDYAPLRHGPAKYHVAQSKFEGLPDGDDAMAAQARRFIESYLKRKTQT